MGEKGEEKKKDTSSKKRMRKALVVGRKTERL